MSIGPIDKLLSASELFSLNPAVTLSVLQVGIDSGSLHPFIDAAGRMWFKGGTDIYPYLVKIGILTPDPLGVVPDAFVYR